MTPVYEVESARWSATRNAAHVYGFAAGFTEITVTDYDVVGGGGEISPCESFTLRRPRRD